VIAGRRRAPRGLPQRLIGLAVAALVACFIALPLGAMLVRSFDIAGPLPAARLAALAEQALAGLDPAARTRFLDYWPTAPAQQRMEAIAGALELSGTPGAWDRKDTFDHQIAAADAALAALSPDAAAVVAARLPLVHVMLHRRVALAFAARDHLSPVDYDELRTGLARGYGLDHYRAVLAEPRLRRAAGNSLMLGVTVTLLATPLAFALAFAVNRARIPGAGIARWAVLVPLVSPPVVIATATIMLFGRSGLVTRDLFQNTLALTDADVVNLYGYWGVVTAQILSFLPAAFIVFDNVLSKLDGRLEEAAASQGASPWQVFREVTLPMAQPGAIRAATLVFILSLTDFGNPLVIGKDMSVLAGVLYDEMIGFSNTPLASAIAVWLILPALCMYWLLGRIGRHKRYETSGLGRPADLPLPRFIRGLLSVVTWGVVGVTALIYATIVLGAFVRVWGEDFNLTLDYFASSGAVAGFVSEFVGVRPVWTSVKIAAAAAAVGGLLSVLIAWLAERAGGVLTAAVTAAVLLPAILPGAVFGIGYLIAFNAPFGIASLSLSGSQAILVLNVLFGNLFVGMLAARAALRRLDRSVEEAAEVMGAGLLRRFVFVTLPMMRRAAILGGLYIFIDGMCTFSAVAFLQGPGINLASVAIFQSASSAYYGVACAMSVSILAIALGAMLLAGRLDRGARGGAGPAIARIRTA
jgi:iron(III) transport system permease protein